MWQAQFVAKQTVTNQYLSTYWVLKRLEEKKMCVKGEVKEADFADEEL